MIRYTLEREIQKPTDQVVRLFMDRELMFKWQPGLLSSDQVVGSESPRYKLRFAFGRRKMTMTETIIRNELPAYFEGTYEMKGVHNRVINRFIPLGNHATRWVCENEFRFKGIMRIVAYFMRDSFRQQSEIIMKNFKGFAESYRI